MKRLRGIVQSSNPPLDKEVLWLYKGSLFYFEAGTWKPILDGQLNDKVMPQEDLSAVKLRIDNIEKTVSQISNQTTSINTRMDNVEKSIQAISNSMKNINDYLDKIKGNVVLYKEDK